MALWRRAFTFSITHSGTVPTGGEQSPQSLKFVGNSPQAWGLFPKRGDCSEQSPHPGNSPHAWGLFPKLGDCAGTIPHMCGEPLPARGTVPKLGDCAGTVPRWGLLLTVPSNFPPIVPNSPPLLPANFPRLPRSAHRRELAKHYKIGQTRAPRKIGWETIGDYWAGGDCSPGRGDCSPYVWGLFPRWYLEWGLCGDCSPRT